MDAPTLPTQTSPNNDAGAALDHTLTSVAEDTVDNTDALDDATSEIQSRAQTIAPNAIILAEALTDKAISWRIHNCKISKKIITQDMPLPFLYHYDSLDDSIKQTYPLTPSLLAQFNTRMTADEAAALIGIDKALITNPWHV